MQTVRTVVIAAALIETNNIAPTATTIVKIGHPSERDVREGKKLSRRHACELAEFVIEMGLVEIATCKRCLG